ncbi:hypothetical protein M9Y10_036004 [Tritrichomonas musculus]|uniref:Uncharacterized protein n=1 Tax=Tritrichomonas musculus TaxID=1915356 RepID=A0ABR2GVV2_9EUKA
MSEELELENRLRVKINPKELTAKVIESPNVTGTVIVPRYAISEKKKKKKCKIITIGYNAFYDVKFDSLIFAEDSEVESFEGSAFFFASFKKLQIPPKLKKLSDQWCYCVRDLIDIEVSRKNELFSYVDNKYLVGKSDARSDVFDILYYARYDIEEAVIPPQIKIIHNCSFSFHPKLQSVISPTKSNLKRIESLSFFQSTISKLVLPETLEYIHCDVFHITENLKEIEISEKNKLFSVIDETLFVTKSDRSLKGFDALIFCRRDAENVKIPSSIKVINTYAFYYCRKLTTMAFEGGSSLETICKEAISVNHSLKSIVFPPSVKYVNERSINCNHNLESVEFLGDYVKIDAYNFQCCSEGMALSFPNAKKLEFDKNSMELLPEGSKVKIRRGAELVGEEFSKIKSKIEFIESNETSNQKVYTSSEKVYQEIKNTKIEKEEEFSIEKSSIKSKSIQT